MELPLNAQVECTDGLYGHSVAVLINPLIDQVTYLVVKADSSPNTEYMVPVEFVAETVLGTIQLRCSQQELEQMQLFIQTEFVQKKVPVYSDYRGGMVGMGSYYMPYVTSEIAVQVPVERQQIPLGELAVRRGTRVEATDGYIGHVDEFVISPENGFITHLVMREGHLWGQKEVLIPLSALGETSAETVFLNFDKHQVESLPTFPVHRLWS